MFETIIIFSLFSVLILYLIIFLFLKKRNFLSYDIFLLMFGIIAFIPTVTNFRFEYNAIIASIYLIFSICFVGGYNIFPKKQVKTYSQPAVSCRKLNILSLLIYCVAIFFFYLIIRNYESFYFFKALGRQGRVLAGRELGQISALGIYNDLLMVSLVLSLIVYYLSKKKKYIFTLSIVFFTKVFIALSFISRNYLVEAFVAYLVVFSAYRTRIKNYLFVCGFVAVFLFASVFKPVIGYVAKSKSLSDIEFRIIVELITEKVDINGNFLAIQYYIIKDIVQDYENIPSELKYGFSYFESFFVRPIPFIKNKSLSQWYIERYNPDMYGRGGGRGFSHIAEAVLNFYVLGPALLGFCLGLLSRRLYDLAFVSKQPVFVAIYAIFLMSVFRVLRSESTSVINGYVLYRIFPLVICFMVANIKMNFFLKLPPAGGKKVDV